MGESTAIELVTHVDRCVRLFTKSFAFPSRHTARRHIPASLVMSCGQVTEFTYPLVNQSGIFYFQDCATKTSHAIHPVFSLSSSASQTQRIQGEIPRPWGRCQQIFSIKGQRVYILGFGGIYSLSWVLNSAVLAGKQPWTICKWMNVPLLSIKLYLLLSKQIGFGPQFIVFQTLPPGAHRWKDLRFLNNCVG